MQIPEIRREIDTIDGELLALFSKRMELAEQIGKLKKAAGLEIYNPVREQEILDRVQERTADELSSYARLLFSTLFDLSRSYQKSKTKPEHPLQALLDQALQDTPEVFPAKAVVACQGVEASYAQLAADKAFPFADILYFKTFHAVFSAVEKGLCRYGLLPIENSSHGSVNAVYDLMQDHHFFIVREVKLPIRHKLLAASGVKLSELGEILSHEQALGQCSAFLETLPDVKISRCENTATAAKLVAESGRRDLAAISSADCAAVYGLDILKENIQNHGHNYTRFILISRKPEIYPGADKISILFSVDNQPGALGRILSLFSSCGINLSKLESRPVQGTDFQYVFYADLEADPKAASVQRLLAQMANELDLFVFLGAYQQI